MQRSRANKGIRVEHQYVTACRFLIAQIVGANKSEVRLGFDYLNLRVLAADELDRSITRSVVNIQDLLLQRVLRRLDLAQAFVDQFSDEDEDPTLGRLGATRPLRHLLAPRGAAGERPLVTAKHVTISQVTRQLLATARLVVMAGVEDPSPAVAVLREYVQQTIRLEGGGWYFFV